MYCLYSIYVNVSPMTLH